jgi:hypothetical protein
MRNCREFFVPPKFDEYFSRNREYVTNFFDFSVLNSAEKQLTCINQIQVKIGAAVADSVFFFWRHFSKIRKIKFLKEHSVADSLKF